MSSHWGFEAVRAVAHRRCAFIRPLAVATRHRIAPVSSLYLTQGQPAPPCIPVALDPAARRETGNAMRCYPGSSRLGRLGRPYKALTRGPAEPIRQPRHKPKGGRAANHRKMEDMRQPASFASWAVGWHRWTAVGHGIFGGGEGVDGAVLGVCPFFIMHCSDLISAEMWTVCTCTSVHALWEQMCTVRSTVLSTWYMYREMR